MTDTIESLRSELAAEREKASGRTQYCLQCENLARQLEAEREKVASRDEVIVQRNNMLNRADAELDRRKGDARTRLHNLCEGIAQDRDGSEFSREEWERIDSENLRLTVALRRIAKNGDIESIAGRIASEVLGVCDDEP